MRMHHQEEMMTDQIPEEEVEIERLEEEPEIQSPIKVQNDRMPERHSRRPKRTSQLYEHDDHPHDHQKSWLICSYLLDQLFSVSALKGFYELFFFINLY